MMHRRWLFPILLLYSAIFMSVGAGQHTINMLVVGDPFSLSLERIVPEFERTNGSHLHIEILSYNDTRNRILLNHLDEFSSYDIVSFDVVWLSEFAESGTLMPLNERIAQAETLNPEDFLAAAYTSSAYGEQQFGLPIQPHPELLWYRTDIIAEPPTTTDDLLRIAQAHTQPESQQYGICWNAQRGQALGQSMAHFYAAFGQPILVDGQPMLDTPQGIEAARYALNLLAVSPPDIINMAWDQRTQRFAAGGCAMTYGWAARSYLVESVPTSTVSGLVGYAPPPHQRGKPPITPIGTWSLGIPGNLSSERQDAAWEALAWLSTGSTQTRLAELGNGGAPRYSVIENPQLIRRYPAFPTIATLATNDELQTWMRPAVPEWTALAEVMGTVYHDMLRGNLSPEEATQEAQRQALMLFNEYHGG